MKGEDDPTERSESKSSRWRDLALFAALPLCLGTAVIAVTLALPGSSNTSPRALFSNCLLNGVAAIALSGVIQVWFTMGETRRADRERGRADREAERANRETARADLAAEQVSLVTTLANSAIERADRAERNMAELRDQVTSLTETVAELQRRLDERSNGSSQT